MFLNRSNQTFNLELLPLEIIGHIVKQVNCEDYPNILLANTIFYNSLNEKEKLEMKHKFLREVEKDEVDEFGNLIKREKYSTSPFGYHGLYEIIIPGISITKYNYVRGIKHGNFERITNGVLELGEYSKGKKVGLWEVFAGNSLVKVKTEEFDNNYLKRKTLFMVGRIEGCRYPNVENLITYKPIFFVNYERSTQYFGGRRKIIFAYGDGYLFEVIHFEGGIPTYTRKYYPKSGNVLYECGFIKFNVKHGAEIYYFKNGQIHQEANYSFGKIKGKVKRYDAKGRKL